MKTVNAGKTKILDVEREPGDPPLKDCPFCGGEGKLEHTWTACYSVKCESCGAEVSGESAYNLRDAKGRLRFRAKVMSLPYCEPGEKVDIDYQPAAHLAAALDAIACWERRQ